MAEMNDLERIRAFFAEDRFATENGMVIDAVEEGRAVCSMEITGRHLNAVGAVMGGVYCTLADFAFAVAVNHRLAFGPGPSVVSLQSGISFMKGARGGKLIAEAVPVDLHSKVCTYRIDVKDDKGRLVAQVTTTGYIKE